MKRTLAMLLAAAGFLVHPVARADIFRCAGAGGTTMFTDTPCPVGMQTTDVIASAKGVVNEQATESQQAAESRQVAIGDEERRRIDQDLAAREEALRRAEQELAMREDEAFRRAEEDARLRAQAPVDAFTPVAPYYEVPMWYPVVVVPSRPCVGPRCLPHHPHREPDASHRHDSHGDPHRVQGDGRSYASSASNRSGNSPSPRSHEALATRPLARLP